MIAFVAVTVAALGGGILAERRWPDGAFRLQGRLLELLVFVFLPVVVFFTVIDLDITANVGAGLAFGWTERVAVFAIAWFMGTKVLKLNRPSTGALIVAVVMANTGYLGIPVTTLLLGGDQIGLAVTWDAVVSPAAMLTLGFGAGAAFGTKAGDSGGQRVKAFLVRNPPLYALIIALLVPDGLNPSWGPLAAEVLALTMAPIGFFALGVNLLREHDEEGVRIFPPPFTPPVATAVFLRVIFAPALVFVLARLIIDVPDVFLVEAGMASGINALTVAHLFGLNMRIVVGAIAWSTLLVVVIAAALGGLGVF